jgi:transcription elongation factor Elf1
MASVTDIKAFSFDVCGVVRMVSAGFKAKVKSPFLCSNFCYLYCACQLNSLSCLYSR